MVSRELLSAMRHEKAPVKGKIQTACESALHAWEMTACDT